jgi:hypothetical protein
MFYLNEAEGNYLSVYLKAFFFLPQDQIFTSHIFRTKHLAMSEQEAWL